MLVDDEVIDFANKEMDNVVLSLDGRKEINDHFRKTVGGVGSYDIIVPKFQKFVTARGGKTIICEARSRIEIPISPRIFRLCSTSASTN